MAAKTSFKQQCPSCEAMVPIKDASLVGRKIDCPKCKYRFVVEDPGDNDEAEEEAQEAKPAKKAKPGAKTAGNGRGPANGKAGAKTRPATKRRPDDDEEDEGEAPRPKAKGAANANKLYLGLGLAGVALVLLCVTAYLMGWFGGGDKKKDAKPATASGKPSGSPSSADDKAEPPKNDDKQPAPAVAAGDDASNLLPPDTQLVLNVPMMEFLRSALGRAAFETPGAFRSAVLKQKLGFDARDVERLIVCRNLTAEDGGWYYMVLRMHTTRPIDAKAVEKAMGLVKPAQNVIKGPEYFVTPHNWLAASSGVNLDPVTRASAPAAPGSRPLYVRFVDDKTLVMADRTPMEAFLKAKGQFPLLSQPPAAPKEDEKKDDGDAAQGGGAPAGMGGMQGGPPMNMRGMMGMQGGPPAGMMGMQGGASGGKAADDKSPKGGAGGAQAGAPAGMMGMQGGPPMNMRGMMQGGPPAGMMGGGGPMGRPGGGSKDFEEPTVTSASYLTIQPSLKAMLDQLEAKTPYVLTAAADLEAVSGLLKPLVDRLAARPLFKVVGVAVQMKEGSTASCRLDMECSSEESAKNWQKELHDSVEPLVQMVTSLTDGQFQGRLTEPLVKQGAAGGMFGMGGQNGAGMMGMMGMGGSQPPPGMMNGMMGGATGRPGGMMGMMGQRGGPPAGMMGMMGGNAGNGVEEKKPEEDRTKDGLPTAGKALIMVTQPQPKVVELSGELLLNDHALEVLAKYFGALWIDVKGQTDMAAAQRGIQPLALALRDYQQNHKQFPPGTFPRGLKEIKLPYPPDQHVSWMAALLPELGHGDVARTIGVDASWEEPANYVAAVTVIPEFLDPQNGPETWRVTRHGFGLLNPAATHFVGIAGVGLDAADPEFRKDPANAHKLGVFGYDEPTKVDQIKDGLANTIAVIEVPPTYPAPWMAGGGSTVRGVPESKSVQPFVCTEYKGKRGTFAIMCDGAVRFISADISDKDFQALCTINGNEPVDVDRLAPKVKGPENAELRSRPVPEDVRQELRPAVNVPPAEAPADKSKPQTQVPRDWKEVSSKDGGFSVALPGTPEKDSEALDLPPFGKTQVSSIIGHLKQGQCLFMAQYNAFPRQITKDKDIEGLFDATRDRMLKDEPGLKKVGEQRISWKENPGKEFDYKADSRKGKLVVKQRVYLVNHQRFYVLWGMAADDVASATNVDAFLDSFKLVEGAADKPPEAPRENGGGIREVVEQKKRSNELKQILLGYLNYSDAMNKPPAKPADLAPFIENDKRLLDAMTSGRYVIIWGSSIKNMTAGTSNTVLGYEKDTPTKGGQVVMADGSVQTMTAKQFEAATKASGK